MLVKPALKLLLSLINAINNSYLSTREPHDSGEMSDISYSSVAMYDAKIVEVLNQFLPFLIKEACMRDKL